MNRYRHIRIIFLFVLCIGIAGYITSVVLSQRVDRAQRAQLLKEAQQASLLAPASTIDALSANQSDLSNPLYGTLKQNLMSFRAFNPSVRFVYVLGYRPDINTQFFFVDSEPTTSADYSPPGQLFADTRQQDIDSYLKGEAYTDGPYRDSWGEWVSGYAPIKNSDGTVVALLGIDTATSVWHGQIGFVRTVIGLITLLLSVVVSFIVVFIHQKQKSIEVLQTKNRVLSKKETVLKELQTMAQIGKIQIQFPAETFSFDQKFSELFSLAENDFLDKKTFLSFVHPDDQQKLTHMLEEIISSDILYTWTDIRVGAKDKGFRTFHIYGNVERNELLAPIRFSGIIQDITDIHTS